MTWALDEFVIEGVRTTVPFHREVMRDPEFLAGDVDTAYIERFLARRAGVF
jgi:acetyl-CoA carboxylase biotin carboxylase subunit